MKTICCDTDFLLFGVFDSIYRAHFAGSGVFCRVENMFEAMHMRARRFLMEPQTGFVHKKRK